MKSETRKLIYLDVVVNIHLDSSTSTKIQVL